MTTPAYFQWKYDASTKVLKHVPVDTANDPFNGLHPNFIVDDDQPSSDLCQMRMVPKYADQFPAEYVAHHPHIKYFCMYATSTAGCCRNCWKIDFPGVTGACSSLASARTFYITHTGNSGWAACSKTSPREGYHNTKPYPEGVAALTFPFGKYSSNTPPVSLNIYFDSWSHGVPGGGFGVGEIPSDAPLTQQSYQYDPALNGGKAWSCNGGIFKKLGGTLDEGTCISSTWPETLNVQACSCSELNACGTAFWVWNFNNYDGLGYRPQWQPWVPCPAGCAANVAPSYTPASLPYSQEVSC